MSVRELFWEKIYAPDGGIMDMPPTLARTEVTVAAAIAAVWLALCILLIRRVFFLISEDARSARAAALVFGIGTSTVWVLGSLDRLGLDSTKCMLIIMVAFVVGTFAYLGWVRSR